ncbi:MAG TPA: hypothetical protein EYN54_03565 [Methylococcaceae bacterium]|nr:hypothetical protein [Methylococcaceae bacterium]HIO45100.1 hypothetical protein [Methylococcales bacterium]
MERVWGLKKIVGLWKYFLIIAVVWVTPVQAKTIALAEIPAAVLTGLKKHHHDAGAITVDKETHFGLTLYEVKFVTHGKQHQALFDQQGRSFAHEEAINIQQLPPSVQSAVKKLFNQLTLKDAEVIHHPDGRIEYEIDVLGDGLDWELVLDNQAKLLSKERD